jgi:hypothetical protein
MSCLGLQLFRLSIRSRTGASTAGWIGLRYICCEPWMGWGSGHTPFRLLGPPEVLRSTFTVNSYPDDTQDPIRDRLNNRTDVGLFNMTLSDYTQYRIREPYEHFGLPELGSCLFFYRSFIYKQRIYTLPREKNHQMFCNTFWSCPGVTVPKPLSNSFVS